MTARSESVLSREVDIETILASPDSTAATGVPQQAAALLEAAEAAIGSWLRASGESPTEGEVEGFRLLALHRQGARVDPSFNACRESCRELIYQCNMAQARPTEATQRLRLAAMVCRHLQLFIAGKMENAALGEFCCAAKPLRKTDTN